MDVCVDYIVESIDLV